MEVVCLTVPYYCVLPGVPSLSSLYSILKYTELVEWLLMIIKTSNQQHNGYLFWFKYNCQTL